MKKHYWFIGLFGIWCLLSSLWYFLSVKGVNTNPPFFNPHNSLIAIVEILIMLLVACLLGYAIAWWLRGETIEAQEGRVDKLHAEKADWSSSHAELKNQVELWRDKHNNDLAASQQRVAELISQKEKLQTQVIDLESLVAKAQEAQSEVKKEDPEANTLRYRVRQLEFQVNEKDETIERLKNELKIAQSKTERASVSDHPFVRQLEADDRDDLTKIKGVGPFIEKRLNMIGIYTFRQLAELSPELVDRVGAAIEFFPHRIVRDNWVGQATRLSAN